LFIGERKSKILGEFWKGGSERLRHNKIGVLKNLSFMFSNHQKKEDVKHRKDIDKILH